MPTATSPVIGCLQVTLRLPACQSLKAKRQVLAGLLRRVRSKFGVAVAEIRDRDRWQLAGIAIVCASADRAHADEVLAHVLTYLEGQQGDVVLADVRTELIPM
ncbi:MAG: DUF503 domain-containing protein [Candidatus Dormiibacterota bacterium]